MTLWLRAKNPFALSFSKCSYRLEAVLRQAQDERCFTCLSLPVMRVRDRHGQRIGGIRAGQLHAGQQNL